MKRIFIVLTLSFLFAVSLTATAYADSGDESATEEDATEQLRSGELGNDAESGDTPKVEEGEVKLGPAYQDENPNAPKEENVELGPAHQGKNPNAPEEDQGTELAPAWQGPNPDTTEQELPEAGAPLALLGVFALMFSAFGGILVRKS